MIGQGATTRASAQKVVIFFTDGTPTTNNTFSGVVANGAVASAKALKDADTLIYTIGVYEEADPSDLSKNFNQYMHAVSSNFPAATAYNNRGNRAENSNYYLSAVNSNALDNVFSGILEDVTSLKASAATQVEEGNEGYSGYITFVDPLGKYMKVDDFKAISFAERNFTNKSVTTNGNITTYTFEGENANNPIYPTTGNLNQIIITVEESATLSVGDVVTVKIPGALIPIHYYEVNIDEDGAITMIEDTTLPIRIWYGVSVKEQAEKALENPDAEFKAYINANKDSNGNVMFYSNLYEEGTESVYSTFEPNQKNNFYFFQNDEYLFVDQACTQPATQINDNTIYYYQRDYYHPKANPSFEKEAEKLVNTTALPGSGNLIAAGYAKLAENGQYYVPKGTPRTTSISEYEVQKNEIIEGATNRTGTSNYAIKPAWLNVMNNPTTVRNELGNNGIIKKTIPGTLAVKKLVTASEGLIAPEGKQFTFLINLDAAEGETLKDVYTAQIFAADGTAIGNEFEFEPEGDNEVVLAADQSVYIYGLAAGTSYSVTEIDIPDGFTKVGDVNEGIISSGELSEEIITNNYSVDPITFTGAQLGLTGTKILEGREFKAGDSFEFKLSTTVFSPDAPMPRDLSEAIITINPTDGNSESFDIGTFTFQKPGEYHYELREIIPAIEDKLAGVSYDSTIYRFIITIADNQVGGLVLDYLEIDKIQPGEAEWTLVYSGDIIPNENTGFVEFTNTYNSTVENIVVRGTKILNNKSLADYANNPFSFNIIASGSRTGDGEFVADDEQPMPAITRVFATSTGDIIFPNIIFDSEDIGKEYQYRITETIPTGAQLDNLGRRVHNGIIYDGSTKIVTIRVTSIVNGEVEEVVPVVTGNQFIFTNTYETNAVEYKFEGVKNLIGRDFKDGDTFTFEIENVGDAPVPVDSQNNEVDSVTITPSGTEGFEFDFGTVTFDYNNMLDGLTSANGSERTKTFTYLLKEIDLGANGITYDTIVRTLTIELLDSNGVLSITAVKVDGNDLGNSKIIWNNTYNASINYGGINVIKTLLGKKILKDEFTFKLTAEAGTPELSDDDKQFSIPLDSYYNPASNASSVVMPKLATVVFDQDDAGKTFSYIAEEVVPTTTGRVDYDKSQYRVELKPYDNGNGTMGVKTVITQIMNAEGQAINNGQSAEYDSKDTTTPSVHFINSYDIENCVLDGETNLLVTKLFFGRQWTENDEFKFDLEFESGDESGVIMPTETVITINKDTPNHQKAFGDITFTKEGIYTFNIKEQVPEGGKKNGITYDTNISEIVIRVSNNGSGAYDVENISTDTLTFINLYEIGTGTSVIISGEKNVQNMVLEDGDFTFELYDADENFEVKDEPETAQNQNGIFEFTIGYAPTDVGKTFYYVLREENAGQIINGIEYDSTEYHITVTVEDDGVGGAKAVKTVMKGSTAVDEIEFLNVYAVRSGASIKVDGAKKLTGRDIKDNEFTFELVEANAQFVATQNVVASARNVSEAFEMTVEYQPTDATKTFYYVFREKNAGQIIDGVEYDSTEYHITVNLLDNGVGGMTAIKTIVRGQGTVDTVEFINEYTTAKATKTISVIKKLEGRELNADEFTFKLFAADSNYAYDKENALQVIKNSAEGKFQFAELAFDAAETYYFVVVEDASAKVKGITYDETVYLIEIEVYDNGNGALVAKEPIITKQGIEGEVEDIIFNNVYIPEPTVIPETRDNRNLWLWLSLLFVSACGFTAINIKKKEVETKD